MLLLSIALVVLVFVAVMLVAGNNLSACVGPAVGSRIVTKRFGILVGAAGFSAGLLVQGSGMIQSVGTLLPNASPVLRAEALLVAIIVFVIAYKIRVPMSLSMALVGLLAGLSVAGKSPANGIVCGRSSVNVGSCSVNRVWLGFWSYSLLKQELANKLLASPSSLQGAAYSGILHNSLCDWSKHAGHDCCNRRI